MRFSVDSIFLAEKKHKRLTERTRRFYAKNARPHHAYAFDDGLFARRFQSRCTCARRRGRNAVHTVRRNFPRGSWHTLSGLRITHAAVAAACTPVYYIRTKGKIFFSPRS